MLKGIANSLHLKQMDKFHRTIEQMVGDAKGDIRKATKHKPRILIAAPSNAAVDNVILKIMEEGFVDGNGNRYNPVICRVGIGSNKNEHIKNVALDTYVDGFLSESNDVELNGGRIEALKAENGRVLDSCRKHIGRLRTLQNHMNGNNNTPTSVAPEWSLYCHVDHDDPKSPFRGTAIWNNHQTKSAQTTPPPNYTGPGSRRVSDMDEHLFGFRELMPLISRFISTQNSIKK